MSQKEHDNSKCYVNQDGNISFPSTASCCGNIEAGFDGNFLRREKYYSERGNIASGVQVDHITDYREIEKRHKFWEEYVIWNKKASIGGEETV